MWQVISFCGRYDELLAKFGYPTPNLDLFDYGQGFGFYGKTELPRNSRLFITGDDTVGLLKRVELSGFLLWSGSLERPRKEAIAYAPEGSLHSDGESKKVEDKMTRIITFASPNV